MKSKINAIVLLAVGLMAFSASSSPKRISLTQQQVRSVIFKDGPGPMCFPHSDCGFINSNTLFTDGTGPMCFPRTGCGYRDGNIESKGVADLPAQVLLADGTGPMCFPSTGCGYVSDVPANAPEFSRERLPV